MKNYHVGGISQIKWKFCRILVKALLENDNVEQIIPKIIIKHTKNFFIEVPLFLFFPYDNLHDMIYLQNKI